MCSGTIKRQFSLFKNAVYFSIFWVVFCLISLESLWTHLHCGLTDRAWCSKLSGRGCWGGWRGKQIVVHSVKSDSLQPHGLQYTRLPCPSPSPRACSNSCPLGWWCHPTISFSVVPVSSCLQSFPSSGSFLMRWLFALGGQSIGASALASVLSVSIQGWSPLGLTGLIYFQSKGLSRVFSNTTVQKHQFFGAQPFLWSNYHHWKKHSFDYMDLYYIVKLDK